MMPHEKQKQAAPGFNGWLDWFREWRGFLTITLVGVLGFALLQNFSPWILGGFICLLQGVYIWEVERKLIDFSLEAWGFKRSVLKIGKNTVGIVLLCLFVYFVYQLMVFLDPFLGVFSGLVGALIFIAVAVLLMRVMDKQNETTLQKKNNDNA